MRLGEFILRAPKLDAAPTAIKDVIFSNPGAALKGIGHALFGWMLAAPVLVVLFAQLLRPIFAWAAQRYCALSPAVSGMLSSILRLCLPGSSVPWPSSPLQIRSTAHSIATLPILNCIVCKPLAKQKDL